MYTYNAPVKTMGWGGVGQEAWVIPIRKTLFPTLSLTRDGLFSSLYAVRPILSFE